MMKTFLPAEVEQGIPGKRSPLPLNPMLYEADEDPTEQKPYQSLIGGLLFVARMTRPEISFHVNLLGRRATNPSTSNMMAAKGILRYLYWSRSEGIILKKPRHLELKVFADASYGGSEARSQSGVLITLREQPIGWYSRRQDVVSLSITEAEYIADCEGAKDLAWGRQFLKELRIEASQPPTLVTDSEGAYNLSKTSQFLRRSRHIEHRYHYI